MDENDFNYLPISLLKEKINDGKKFDPEK